MGSEKRVLCKIFKHPGVHRNCFILYSKTLNINSPQPVSKWLKATKFSDKGEMKYKHISYIVSSLKILFFTTCMWNFLDPRAWSGPLESGVSPRVTITLGPDPEYIFDSFFLYFVIWFLKNSFANLFPPIYWSDCIVYLKWNKISGELNMIFKESTFNVFHMPKTLWPASDVRIVKIFFWLFWCSWKLQACCKSQH